MASSPGGVEVARVSVRAVPDTSRLFEEFKADLDKIERELSVDIRASVDSAELVASAKEAVAEAQALAGDIDVKARVDSSQIGELDNVLRDTTSGAGSLTSGFSSLAAGGSALGLALIPLTAVIAGLTAALVAPLAISAGGLTIFGFLAGFAVKDVLAQRKQIEQLDSKLSGLTKGTQTYRDTLAQLRNAQAALTPAQAAFSAALDKVSSAFKSFPQGVLLKPLTDAMLLLANVLPDLKPIIKAVSGVLTGLIGDLNRAASSPGFQRFVQAFAKQVGPDVLAFATIAANVFQGLFGLFGAFNKQLSGSVLKGLENLTGRFADFGKAAAENKGLTSFVDYVKQNLPKVGAIVGGAFGVLGKALADLAPAGAIALGLVSGILGVVKQLGPLAGPLAAALAGLAIPFAGPEVGAVFGLVAGFTELYNRSKPLQKVIHDLGDFFTTKLLPPIESAAHQVLPALQGAFKSISDTIRNNQGLFETFGKAILVIGSAVVIGAILTLVESIKQTAAAFKIGTAAVKLFANIALGSFRIILKGIGFVIKAILDGFGAVLDVLANTIGRLPDKVTGGLSSMVRSADTNFHNFAQNTTGALGIVDNSLKDLQTKLNEVGKSNPKFHIDSNTLDLISQMHELQALQIKDKHFKITAQVEQQIEQSTGPGGGIQRPSSLNGGSGGGGKGSGGNGALVHVDKMYAGDTNDIIRKSNRRSAARAGGGVLLPPPLIPSFGG